MPDYEKLVDTSSRGLACLCFANNARLSIKEITEIFSEYGDVIGINCAGNEIGFRFVRFRTKEEALRCAIALNKHPKIRLQPVISKSKESDGNTQRNQFRRNKRDNVNDQRNNQISCNVKGSDRADSTRDCQSPSESKSNNDQKTNQDNGSKNEFNLTSTNDQNPAMKYSNSRSVRNFPKAEELNNERSETENLNNNTNALKLVQLQKLRGMIANTFKPSNNNDINNVPAVPAASASLPIISSPPSSHHSSRGQSMMADDVPPPLVAGGPFLQPGDDNVPQKPVEVLRASDVIIANIHSNMGVSNIYYMLRKFSPIYVSDIETVPEINVRFCYVYFGTPKNALEVEQLFDRASVHGQNWITLRSHRLEVESGVF